ncbi:MAG: salicylate 1-monooxygenase [Betaproteobacteria bacterium SG8_39]|nr:MAG: salicylate 1-monooxygenase [Betaproteobacteria bacterium SG8_39]
MAKPASLRIAIVGGGLGGLAAALFLRRAGLEATVYEQSSALRELGAGIVVAPNMVRPLATLGLAARLPEFAVQLEAAWEFRRWQDGRVLSVQPMGEECLRLYGAHCYVAHRADLLALLQSALPSEALKLDRRCIAVRDAGDAVEAVFADRDGRETTVRADAVIGADGIHSVVRPAVAPEIEARFSGLCAFRCLVPAADAPPMALRAVQTLWLGPERHFVHYPISAGRLVNVVAIVPAGDWRTESWTAEGAIGDLRAEFAGWDARVLQLVDAATDTKRWALYDRTPLARWCAGRVGLLGDAAHAMLPFFAQGAAQAIEDAVVLAACLRGVDAQGVPAALARYDAIRRPRASEVQLMSRGREIRNHLPDGPAQVERDRALAGGDPLRQSAWLYGHDVESALRAG